MTEEQAKQLLVSVKRIEVVLVGLGGSVVVGGLLAVLDSFFNFL